MRQKRNCQESTGLMQILVVDIKINAAEAKSKPKVKRKKPNFRSFRPRKSHNLYWTLMCKIAAKIDPILRTLPLYPARGFHPRPANNFGAISSDIVRKCCKISLLYRFASFWFIRFCAGLQKIHGYIMYTLCRPAASSVHRLQCCADVRMRRGVAPWRQMSTWSVAGCCLWPPQVDRCPSAGQRQGVPGNRC